MNEPSPTEEQDQDEPPNLGIPLLIQFLLIIPWLPFAALSGIAYDSGGIWPAILVVGPFQAYPLLIPIFVGIAARLRAIGKYDTAEIVAWLAPFISLGSLMLFGVIGAISTGLTNRY